MLRDSTHNFSLVKPFWDCGWVDGDDAQRSELGSRRRGKTAHGGSRHQEWARDLSPPTGWGFRETLRLRDTAEA
jgi:hypothetical protein